VRLIVAPNPLTKVTVKVTQMSPEYMIVAYATVPQNCPTTNGNFVQAWQDSQVEWANPTGGWRGGVPGNTMQGDMPLQFLYQNKDYIVGYSVGQNVQNIVATAYLPGGDITQEQFSTTISVKPGQDTLLVDYLTPEGSKPNLYQHRVALLDEDDNPFLDMPLTSAPIPTNQRAGSVPLMYSLATGRSYTVAYYAGKGQNCVACTFTFVAAGD
jgi:hypothetical protein